MSATESTKRPKGFVSWNPRAATRILLEQVQEIMVMYEENLPLTARQIFYRLVGAFDYEKTELAYARLCEHLVRARRCGMIPFSNIRDDGTIQHEPLHFEDAEHWWDWAEDRAENFTINRMMGQDQSIEVWCEAGGMAPQLFRVTRKYGIPVYSTGGFSSVTVTHEIAQRVVRDVRPTMFLHIGDFDPSGQSIYESMCEDVDTFVRQFKGIRERNPDKYEWVEEDCGFEYRRVALTGDQVVQYDLPTAPAKKSDSRTAAWIGETCQAEAMAPDDLANTLEDTILEYIDQNTMAMYLEQEKETREVLHPQVQRVRNL
jgi:hypothetical protein